MHWTKPVTGSRVACQIWQWASGEKLIKNIQSFIICNVNLCVKQFALFSHEQSASWRQANNHIIGEILSEQGKKENNQNWKGKKDKLGKRTFWCCSSTFDKGSHEADTGGWDKNYGIGLVSGYGYVDGRVRGQHQRILKLMSCLNFSQM